MTEHPSKSPFLQPVRTTQPYDARLPKKDTMKKNEYRMWPNGPTIELPAGYHWDAATQEVVKNDLTWRGGLIALWRLQQGFGVEKNPEICPQCGQPLTWVEASDFLGWSCMSTPLCCFRLPVDR